MSSGLSRAIAARTSFWYGWIVLACLCLAGFSRQGPAVATLSIFVEPLTREFGWSRTALSGAVSLGGLLAALVTPAIGPMLDRRGSRVVLCAAVLVNGVALLLLSLTPSLLVFYLLFCVARMNWAGPFDIGIYGAISNWFVRRRSLATSLATLAQMAGLVAMPLIAQFAIVHDGWRTGWLALGVVTLAVGFVPVWLLLARRPEDLGLVPDANAARAAAAATEPGYSRAEAIRMPAFWLLMLYAVLIYPVQAGVSLHQTSHLIERGVDATIAATIVAFFSLMSGVGAAACGLMPRRIAIRFPLAATGLLAAAGVMLMARAQSAAHGYAAVAFFGLAVGGMLTLLPIAWADYFGREHFGAIRSLALSAQVVAQACGPLISGALRDLTGSYAVPFSCFAVLAIGSALAALAARPPRATAGGSPPGAT